jgi:imidazolonepropionase
MPVLINISELNSCRDEGGQGDVHPIADAALAWIDDRIEWVGPRHDLPAEYAAYEMMDAGGALVVPGLIDCHTHLAFGGWRADEFELRCRGTTYQEIAAAGGGILNTVEATRAASEDDLVVRAGAFAREMMRLGVTTMECKSGYGLSTDEERKLLRVYRRLEADLPVEIVPTFLGAHTVPPEYRDRRAAYVELLCIEMIPGIAAEGLADFCDIFLETGAFTVREAREVLNAGAAHGLRPKLHADQLTDGGGALFASEVGAASADHLEFASREGMRAMAATGVVAVNLPIASLFLRQPPLDARAFIEEGVCVAVATDFNPGSAPSYHLPLAMTLACTMSRMTPAEALKGATIYAARALNRADRIGSLERGKRADFVLVEASSVNHWLYHFRPNAVRAVYASGIRL